MKKKLILMSLVAISAVAVVVTHYLSNRTNISLLKENLEALTDEEGGGVFGNCLEKDRDCVLICPHCGAAYWAPGHLGGAYHMSGTCVSCNKSI